MSAVFWNTKSFNRVINSSLTSPGPNQNDFNKYQITKEDRSSIPLLNLDETPIATELLFSKNNGNFVSNLSRFNLSVESNNQLVNPSSIQPLLNSDRAAIDDFFIPEIANPKEVNVSPLPSKTPNLGDASFGKISRESLATSADQLIQNVGSTTSQAKTATNADIVTNQFGFTGDDVTIGVISDSFNSQGGASSDIASGDLPSDVNVLSDLQQGGTDEGRAMLQLIHDVAPDANLAFHTAAGGKVNFAQGILELAQAGADIIVDDVAYLNEPFFQDGIISQAIDQVTEQGVTYFSAAGNSGRQSYQSEFRPSGQVFDLGNFRLEAHDFDPSSRTDLFQELTIPQGEQVKLSFQWDKPFPNLSGGKGAQNDVDIFLLNEDKTDVIAGSFEANQGKNPLEIFSFTNDSSVVGNTFNLAIGKTLDSESPDLMKYIGFENLSIEEFDTNSSTIFGHANAEGAISVGAAAFTDTPAFGTNPPQVEEFSSTGGTPIQFDNQGNRLQEVEVRKNPDIVAPDGTNTTFFGKDIPADSDSNPNFFGTSAAAPHAAATAALLKEADPSLTPAQIENLLETTAIDMDDPSTSEFDTGFDPVTGQGLIQADEALSALESNQQPLATSESLTLDVDDNGDAQALTDGVLIARYLFGLRGEGLVNNAVAPDAARDSADAIESYLSQAESSFLDVDGNRKVKGETDGFLTLRFLLGRQGNQLVDNVIGEDATRHSGEEVQNYLEQFLPEGDIV